MLLFYIRHGDPIYDPDSLTELGKKQAAALAKRLALYGLDKIYASTSPRAIMTAQPTCDLLKKEMTLLDFCNEGHAWQDFTISSEEGTRVWLYASQRAKMLFTSSEIRKRPELWYEHPEFKAEYDYRGSVERMYGNLDAFLASHGYEHIRGTGQYRAVRPNDERIAVFAHEGMGMAFLSCLLDIPYPVFACHFGLCHSGMTVIEFKTEGGMSIPRMLTLSSDSHLYREGLPTNYNNMIRF